MAERPQEGSEGQADPSVAPDAQEAAARLAFARTFTGFADRQLAPRGDESVFARVNDARLGAGTPHRGTLWVTNRRVVFRGEQRGLEIPLRRLTEQRSPSPGELVLVVDGRARPVVLSFDPGAGEWVPFRLQLALAHARGTLADLIAQLEADAAG